MSYRQKISNLIYRALKWGGLPLQDPALAAFFGPGETASGAAVDEYNALTVSAVFAAVRAIAEPLSTMEFVLYDQVDPKDKQLAIDHELWPLIHDDPNPEMTNISFRCAQAGHVITWGNAYAEIERKKSGRPYALWPITPNRVRPRRNLDTRQIVYDVFPNAASPYALQALPIQGTQMATIPKEDMLHVPGLGFDGLLGYSVITLAREAIGLTLGTEKYGAGFFGNSSRPSGVLKHPGRMKEDARKNLRESWEKMHGGLSNAQRTALLEEGVTWEAIGLPPEDSQFLQTRKFQISEIARWFNVPPHMLRDLERATFSNIEHQGIDFVIYTLLPWMTRFEQEWNRKLLFERERRKYFTKHLPGILLQGDFKTRMEAYQLANNNGILNPDECREREGLNHREDGGGKEYRRPLNIVPDSTPVADPNATPAKPEEGSPVAPQQDSQTTPDAADTDKKTKAKKDAKKVKQAADKKKRAALIAAQRGIIHAAAERMAGIEATAVRRAAKTPREFTRAIEEFYGRFRPMLSGALEPGLRAHLVLVGSEIEPRTIAGSQSDAYASNSQRQLLDAAGCSPDQFETTIEKLVQRWESQRPAELADALMQEELAA